MFTPLQINKNDNLIKIPLHGSTKQENIIQYFNTVWYFHFCFDKMQFCSNSNQCLLIPFPIYSTIPSWPICRMFVYIYWEILLIHSNGSAFLEAWNLHNTSLLFQRNVTQNNHRKFFHWRFIGWFWTMKQFYFWM